MFLFFSDFRESEEYTEVTLGKACQLHAGMGADMGGTEILQPLKAVYSKPPKVGYARQVSRWKGFWFPLLKVKGH